MCNERYRFTDEVEGEGIAHAPPCSCVFPLARHATRRMQCGHCEGVVEPFSAVPTTVVRLRRRGGHCVQGSDVYIGRRINQGGWCLPASKWANPYSVKSCGSAEEAIRRYTVYLSGTPALLADLHELKGRQLGCWCAPGPCHGDVLARMADAEPAKKDER